MKKLAFTAAAAVTCATAQAQSYNKEDYQSTSHSDFFVSYSAGYLIDNEDILHSVRVGLDKGCVSFYAQWAHFEVDETIRSVSLDLESNAFSLGVIGHHSFDSKISGYFGGSIGVANNDLTLSLAGLSASASDDNFYFDIVTGLEYEFSENVTGNLGLRYLYINDFKPSFGSTTIDFDSLDDLAIEAGITVSF